MKKLSRTKARNLSIAIELTKSICISAIAISVFINSYSEPLSINSSGGNRKLNPESNYTPSVLFPPAAKAAETDPSNTVQFTVTAYCGCNICCGSWADLREGQPVYGAQGTELIAGTSVAVDNSIYAFGTQFVASDGRTYIAQDTGSAIIGNRLDLYFVDHQQALEFGVQEFTLEVIENEKP